MCQICSKPCFNVNFKQVSHCRLWTTKCRMSSFCSSANQWWFHHKYFPRKYPKVSQKLFCISLSKSFFCVIEFNPRIYIYIYISSISFFWELQYLRYHIWNIFQYIIIAQLRLWDVQFLLVFRCSLVCLSNPLFSKKGYFSDLQK